MPLRRRPLAQADRARGRPHADLRAPAVQDAGGPLEVRAASQSDLRKIRADQVLVETRRADHDQLQVTPEIRREGQGEVYRKHRRNVIPTRMPVGL